MSLAVRCCGTGYLERNCAEARLAILSAEALGKGLILSAVRRSVTEYPGEGE